MRVRYAPFCPSLGPVTRSPSQCPNSSLSLIYSGLSAMEVVLRQEKVPVKLRFIY